MQMLMQGLTAGRAMEQPVAQPRGEVLGQILNALGVPSTAQRTMAGKAGLDALGALESSYEDPKHVKPIIDSLEKAGLLSPEAAVGHRDLIGGDLYDTKRTEMLDTHKIAGGVHALLSTISPEYNAILDKLSAPQTMTPGAAQAALPTSTPAEGQPATDVEMAARSTKLPSQMLAMSGRMPEAQLAQEYQSALVRHGEALRGFELEASRQGIEKEQVQLGRDQLAQAFTLAKLNTIYGPNGLAAQGVPMANMDELFSFGTGKVPYTKLTPDAKTFAPAFVRAQATSIDSQIQDVNKAQAAYLSSGWARIVGSEDPMKDKTYRLLHEQKTTLQNHLKELLHQLPTESETEPSAKAKEKPTGGSERPGTVPPPTAAELETLRQQGYTDDQFRKQGWLK